VARFRRAISVQPAGAAPWAGPRDVHALLIVAADWADDLTPNLQRQRQRFAASRVIELAMFRGDSLTGNSVAAEQLASRTASRTAGAARTQQRSTSRQPGIHPRHADQDGQVNNEILPRWSKDGSISSSYRCSSMCRRQNRDAAGSSELAFPRMCQSWCRRRTLTAAWSTRHHALAHEPRFPTVVAPRSRLATGSFAARFVCPRLVEGVRDDTERAYSLSPTSGHRASSSSMLNQWLTELISDPGAWY